MVIKNKLSIFSSMEEVKRTKGYVRHYDRDMCEDCKFFEWVGSGSRKQQMTYCNKIEPNFIVFLEDCCDEFEKK